MFPHHPELLDPRHPETGITQVFFLRGMQDDTIMPVVHSQLDLVVLCDPLHSEYVTDQKAPSIDIPDTDPNISQFRYRHVVHLITSDGGSGKRLLRYRSIALRSITDGGKHMG